MTIKLTSTAFSHGQRIPERHSGEGEDLSPPLVWTGVPEGTKELALICDDPDAPTAEPWVHWVIYKIPSNTDHLPEGVPRRARLKNPDGALQGQNSWSSPPKHSIGYRGPLPPPGHGTHHYHFVLYALDVKLIIEPEVTKKVLLEEMSGHILAEGRLTGVYSR